MTPRRTSSVLLLAALYLLGGRCDPDPHADYDYLTCDIHTDLGCELVGEDILHDPRIGVSDLMEAAAESTVEFVELLLSWSAGMGMALIAVAAVGIRYGTGKLDWED